MRYAALSLLLALAGCPYRIPDGRLICTETEDCPPGFVCNAARTCDRGEGDGDAAIRDAGTSDAPVVCDVDGDGDGACADVDCDDGDDEVYPGGVEACTSSTDGVAPRDENCDGAIDEGCAYHVGEPHWVTDVLARDGEIDAPRLSFDDTTLYAVALDSAGSRVPMMASRARNERFSAFTAIPGDWDEGGTDTLPIESFAVSPDLREALVHFKGKQTRVSRYGRSSPTSPFVFRELVGTDLEHASFSPDGLEMVVSTGLGVALASRSALGMPFGSIREILSDVRGPAFIGPDALLLVRGDTTLELVIARRVDGTFVVTDEVIPLPGPFEDVTYSPAARELFFSSSRAWAPVSGGSASLWRAEICRDGACPARQVTCATDDGERRSTDGTHCYAVNESIRGWSQMSSLCGARRDAHLVSLHSLAERDLVAMLAEDLYWIGGDVTPSNTWDSGEAWTTDFYGPGWPMGPGDCVQFSTAANEMRNGVCDNPFRGICETELWPVW